MVVVVFILVKVCEILNWGVIFSLFQCLHLSILFWSTCSKSALVVNIKVVHLDMVLDDMARFGQGWFKKSQNQGGKLVKIL